MDESECTSLFKFNNKKAKYKLQMYLTMGAVLLGATTISQKYFQVPETQVSQQHAYWSSIQHDAQKLRYNTADLTERVYGNSDVNIIANIDSLEHIAQTRVDSLEKTPEFQDYISAHTDAFKGQLATFAGTLILFGLAFGRKEYKTHKARTQFYDEIYPNID